MRGSGYESMAAACPFYRASYRQKVECGGFAGENYLAVTFRTPGDKQAHFKRCCAAVNGWEACPLAKLIGKQYEETEGPSA